MSDYFHIYTLYNCFKIWVGFQVLPFHSGLYFFTDQAIITAIIANGINISIFYSYEVGSVGQSPSGLTGGVASLYTYSAAKASTVDTAFIFVLMFEAAVLTATL